MAVIAQDTTLDGVKLVQPRRFGDDRGYFSEVFKDVDLAEALGFAPSFVQDNESLSAKTGTLRGLHYQLGEFAQAKLVRVASGAVIDVAVDIRKSSPSFGSHVAVKLTAEEGNQLWIPAGFAHGFLTLTDNTIVNYKTTNYYNADSDRSMSWSDSELAVDWGGSVDASLLSEKDANAPSFSELSEKGEVFE